MQKLNGKLSMKKLLIIVLLALSANAHAKKENRYDADVYLFTRGMLMGCSHAVKQTTSADAETSALADAWVKICKFEHDKFKQACMKLYDHDTCVDDSIRITTQGFEIDSTTELQ